MENSNTRGGGAVAPSLTCRSPPARSAASRLKPPSPQHTCCTPPCSASAVCSRDVYDDGVDVDGEEGGKTADSPPAPWRMVHMSRQPDGAHTTSPREASPTASAASSCAHARLATAPVSAAVGPQSTRLSTRGAAALPVPQGSCAGLLLGCTVCSSTQPRLVPTCATDGDGGFGSMRRGVVKGEPRATGSHGFRN